MSFSNRSHDVLRPDGSRPIIGIGVLGFRLIGATTSGKAGARASGLVTAASEVYTSQEEAGRSAAQAVAEAIARLPASKVRKEITRAAADAGLVRVAVVRDGITIANVGSSDAVAPGTVNVTSGLFDTRVTASVITASQFAAAVAGPLSSTVLSQNGTVLASTIQQTLPSDPPPSHVHIGGQAYATASYTGLTAFSGAPVTLTMLSDLRASSGL